LEDLAAPVVLRGAIDIRLGWISVGGRLLE
jgi:hypothetical protein